MSKFKGTSNKKNDNLNISNDDFESPVVFKKFKSSNDNINFKRIKNKKINNKKQLTLHQVYEDNFKYSDMNSEHLQLALALSRSTTEMHNSSMKEEFPLAFPKDGRKKTLLEFGFKTNKSKINVENKISRKETSRTNKKSKFRFVTPILMMRTEEERESLIQSKLSSLFGQNTVDSSHVPNLIPEVSSEELGKIRCRECSIFFLDRKVDSPRTNDFVVSNLNIEQTRAESGSLLKEWKKIPLRDPTPERSKAKMSHLTEDPKISNLEIESVGVNPDLLIPEKDKMNIISPSNERTDVSQSVENGENLSNLQLSVEYRNVVVSPDLFDNDSVLSENHVLLNNPPIKVRRNLRNIFSQEEIRHESDIVGEFQLDLLHFADDDCGAEKLIEQEEPNFFSINDIEFIENECEEKKNYVENKTQNLSAHSKNEEVQLSRSRNSLHLSEVNTVVVSSDEEFLTTENTSSEAKNSLHSSMKYRSNDYSLAIAGNNFDDDKDKNIDPDITEVFEMSERKLPNGSDSITKSKNLYCLDDEDTDFPLVNDNIVSNANIENSNEIIYSSDEEKEEHLSDNLKLKKLSEKYTNYLKKPSVDEKKSNSVQFNSSEHNLSEKMLSNVFSEFDSRKFNESCEEKEIDARSSGFSSEYFDECDEFLDIISSSDDEMDGQPGTPKIKFSDNLREPPLGKSNRMKYDLSDFEAESPINSHDRNCYDMSRSKNYSSVEYEKPKEILFDSLSDSLLEQVFEGNCSQRKNDSYESKKRYNCSEAQIEGHNEEKYKVVNSKKGSNTPLRRYASFADNATAKRITNFTRHKSESNITPNRKFVMKTVNITPIADYNAFSTPEIVRELDKFGLKPLKRKRGINLLEHIYETIHPKVEVHKLDVKRKRSDGNQTVNLGVVDSYREKIELEVLKRWSGTISESDAIFERQLSSKISTCRIPLQIVWHNFLNDNPKILENILLYEPLQVEVIHKMLKEEGYKFHLQDLITFFDQKCITFRVAQNGSSKVK